MEEKRGTYLSEVVVRLAEWGFSLMPYGVAGSMLICRAILGWSDTPLWEVWYPVFLVSMAGRYLVHVLKIAYGWKNYVYHEGRTSWAMVAVDAAATVATVAYIALYGGETISWYWRYYVISYWIGGGLLAVWLIARTGQDFESWWRSRDDNVPCQGFCEYVRAVNAAAAMEQNGGQNDAGGGRLEV